MFTHYTDDDPHTDIPVGNYVLRYVDQPVQYQYYLFTATGELEKLLRAEEVEAALTGVDYS